MAARADLEDNGWRQGVFVRREDIGAILHGFRESVEEHTELLVVSQSCDVVQPAQIEPVVEMILAERIAQLDGTYTFSRNPRILHLSALRMNGSNGLPEDFHLKLTAFDKIAVAKERFIAKTPDSNKAIPTDTLKVLASWLAARYDRPALPSAFNTALEGSDPGARRRKRVARRLSAHTSGVYIEITPKREIQPDERYAINLLGLILPSHQSHRAEVEADIEALGELMASSGMDVQPTVRSEEEVSVSTLKRFQRFYFDDISFRGDDPLPVEVETRQGR